MSTQKIYRATRPLFVGRARAFNPGDILTADQVESGDWSDGVEPAGQADVTEPGARPAANGSKAAWVAYATSADRGPDQVTVEDADVMTRDELAARFSA